MSTQAAQCDIYPKTSTSRLLRFLSVKASGLLGFVHKLVPMLRWKMKTGQLVLLERASCAVYGFCSLASTDVSTRLVQA